MAVDFVFRDEIESSGFRVLGFKVLESRVSRFRF